MNRAGHLVTVCSSRTRGLLMYGIRNMKLDKKDVVLRRIELMQQEGTSGLQGQRRRKPMLLLKDFDAMSYAPEPRGA